MVTDFSFAHFNGHSTRGLPLFEGSNYSY